MRVILATAFLKSKYKNHVTRQFFKILSMFPKVIS